MANHMVNCCNCGTTLFAANPWLEYVCKDSYSCTQRAVSKKDKEISELKKQIKNLEDNK